MTLMTEQSIDELVLEAQHLGIQPEDLDELVIDSMCAEASDINNGGLDAQLAYLYHALGFEGVLAELDKLSDK